MNKLECFASRSEELKYFTLCSGYFFLNVQRLFASTIYFILKTAPHGQLIKNKSSKAVTDSNN